MILGNYKDDQNKNKIILDKKRLKIVKKKTKRLSLFNFDLDEFEKISDKIVKQTTILRQNLPSSSIFNNKKQSLNVENNSIVEFDFNYNFETNNPKITEQDTVKNNVLIFDDIDALDE